MTYRAAIIGAGAPVASTNSNLEGFSIGYSHARGYLNLSDVEVVAVADVSHDNGRALADFVGGATVYANYRDMLSREQIDILSVCTWPTLHHAMTIAGAEAGVRMILCEKPMAVSIAEMDDMLEATRDTETRLFVNHQRRYEQPFAGIRALLDHGILGSLLRVEGWVGDGWDLMSWGSHWVDMSRYFAQCQAEWVLAAAPTTGNTRYGHRIEDQSLVQIGFESGTLGLVHISPHRSGAGLIVTGSAGAVVTENGTATLMTSAGDAAELSANYLHAAADASDGVTLAIADMIDAYEQDRPSLIDGDSGHATTEIIMAAYQSAATRSAISLPLADRTMNLRPDPATE